MKLLYNFVHYFLTILKKNLLYIKETKEFKSFHYWKDLTWWTQGERAHYFLSSNQMCGLFHLHSNSFHSKIYLNRHLFYKLYHFYSNNSFHFSQLKWIEIKSFSLTLEYTPCILIFHSSIILNESSQTSIVLCSDIFNPLITHVVLSILVCSFTWVKTF